MSGVHEHQSSFSSAPGSSMKAMGDIKPRRIGNCHNPYTSIATISGYHLVEGQRAYSFPS